MIQLAKPFGYCWLGNLLSLPFEARSRYDFSPPEDLRNFSHNIPGSHLLYPFPYALAAQLGEGNPNCTWREVRSYVIYKSGSHNSKVVEWYHGWILGSRSMTKPDLCKEYVTRSLLILRYASPLLLSSTRQLSGNYCCHTGTSTRKYSAGLAGGRQIND